MNDSEQGIGMVRKSGLRLAVSLGAGSALALAAGCATTAPRDYADNGPVYSSPHYTGPDRLYRDNFVRNTRPFDGAVSEPQYAAAPRQAPAITAVSFDGIEGARRAHEMFPESQAERLDGACERFVKITRDETLYDVERLCDVPVSILLAYNPGVRNARHVGAGDVIEVPQVYNPERAAYVASIVGADGAGTHVPAVAYVVQPGETLNEIAARHLVSAAAVANANPTVDWPLIRAGATVWIPSANGVAAPVGANIPVKPSAPVTGGLPYDFKGGSHAGGSGLTYDVTTVMPYQMTPAQQAAESEAPRGLLMINRRTASPGEEVTVTGENLPKNAEVSLYSGPNGSQLKFVKNVTTDANGRFSESVTVSGDAGGIIFQATSGDERLQSPRVGVSKK
jgi:LysM repeat protein